MNDRAFRGWGAAALLCAIQAAYAPDALAGFGIGGTVGGSGSCSVSTTAVRFGLYWGDVPLSSTGSVTPSCTRNNTVVKISLDGGGAGQPTARRMRSGVNTIAYSLYTDAAHSLIWGDGTNGTRQVTVTTIAGVNQSRQIYARIPARQQVAAGSYSDTVVVTVSW